MSRHTKQTVPRLQENPGDLTRVRAFLAIGSNGVQIIPPHDSGIAASIDAHLDIPDESWDPDTIISSSDLCINQTETLKEAYIETLARHPIARYVDIHCLYSVNERCIAERELRNIARRNNPSSSFTHQCTESDFHSFNPFYQLSTSHLPACI